MESTFCSSRCHPFLSFSHLRRGIRRHLRRGISRQPMELAAVRVKLIWLNDVYQMEEDTRSCSILIKDSIRRSDRWHPIEMAASYPNWSTLL